MNDEAVIELISRSLDEPLSPAEQARLDRALAASSELRELAEDLAALKSLAATTVPAASAGAFDRLKERTEQTYPRRRFRVLPGGWAAPALAMAAVIVAGMLLFFRGDQNNTEPDQAMMAALNEAREQLDLAQANFHAAIARMESLAMERLAQLPPEIAIAYTRNLEVINDAIRDCERISHENPGNAISYAALTQSYDAKVRLLEMILEG